MKLECFWDFRCSNFIFFIILNFFLAGAAAASFKLSPLRVFCMHLYCNPFKNTDML